MGANEVIWIIMTVVVTLLQAQFLYIAIQLIFRAFLFILFHLQDLNVFKKNPICVLQIHIFKVMTHKELFCKPDHK
jgi:hypothetical protein